MNSPVPLAPRALCLNPRAREAIVSYGVFGLFLVWCVSFAVKIYVDKHFSLDGVNYFFQILQNQSFADIAWSRRFTELLTEWPLVLSISVGSKDVHFLGKIFGLGIFFPYLLSFALCWAITGRENRALLLFPLASFVGFNLLSDYDVIADHHVLAVMTWPIMMVLVKEKPLKWMEGVLLWILLIAYSRMYETAVVNAALMSIILLVRILQIKTPREAVIGCVSLLLLAVVSYISIRYIVDPRSPTNRGAFLDSILVNRRNWEALATNAFLGIFMLGWLISDRWRRLKNAVFIFALVPILVYLINRLLNPDYAMTAFISFSSRTLIGVVIPGLIIACWLIALAKSRLTMTGILSFGLMFIVMLGANLYDLRNWVEVRNEFIQLSGSEEMFVDIEDTLLGDENLELRHYRWTWNNSQLSLIFSGSCVRSIVLNSPREVVTGPFDPRKELPLKKYLHYDKRFRQIDADIRECVEKG